MDNNKQASEIPTVEASEVQAPPKASRTHLILGIAAIIFVLAAVGVALAWRKKSVPNVPQTADQIRSTFAAPTTSTPNFTPPPPGQQYTTYPNVTGTPLSSFVAGASTSSPAAPVSSKPAPSQPPAVHPRSIPPPSQPRVYHSAAQNFSITLPAGWSAVEQPGSTILFDQHGNQQGYIESYPAGATSLNDVQNMLQNSPSVQSVGPMNVGGQSGLGYKASGMSGAAVIANGRIYYLHGQAAAPPVVSTFQAG